MIPFPFRRKRPPVLRDSDVRARVVIVGGGQGAAKALAEAPVRVTLVDRRNHHLFQPLLYQVATAALSRPTSRSRFDRCCAASRMWRSFLADVDAIDVAAKEVVLGEDVTPPPTTI